MSTRYKYLQLRVMCYNARDFPIDQMGAAVQYLKEQPGDHTKWVGLQAIGKPVKGKGVLHELAPMLTLESIKGKTVAEIWAMFDAQVDEQLEYFRRR